jgi:hypothetical protein
VSGSERGTQNTKNQEIDDARSRRTSAQSQISAELDLSLVIINKTKTGNEISGSDANPNEIIYHGY